MAEFLVNNHINKSTKMTSFFADNGFHLQTRIKPFETFGDVEQKAELLNVDKIVANQERMTSFLQD